MEITGIHICGMFHTCIKICTEILGPEKTISGVSNEDVLLVRKELLTGYQICGKTRKTEQRKGRTVRTVNVYLNCLGQMFKFAELNGYIEKSPFTGVGPTAKSKAEPDPLTKSEYRRLLNASPSEQIRNLWVSAINTGMRHGEIAALGLGRYRPERRHHNH